MGISKKKRKLSVKLFMLVFIITVLGLMTAVAVTNTIVRNAIHYNIIQATHQSMEKNALIIDNWFVQKNALVNEMAMIINALGEEYAYEVTRSFVDNQDAVVIAYLGLPDENMLVSAQLGLDWMPPAGFYVPLRPWFIPVDAGFMSYITEPHVSYAYPYSLVVTVSARLPEFDTVMGADIVIQELVYLVESFELAYGGYMFLVTPEGSIVSHPDSQLAPTTTSLRNLRSFTVYDVFFQNRGEGELTRFISSTGDNSYLLTYRLSSTGWTLAAAVPVATINNYIWGVLAVVLLAFLCVLIIKSGAIAFFVTYFIRKTISEKISHFNDKSAALASGNTPLANNFTDDSFGMDKIDTEFGKVVDDIMRVKDDIMELYGKHEQGMYKARIDTSNHEGIYEATVTKVNDFIAALIGNRTNIITYFRELAEGNFEAKCKNNFVGEEAYINDILNAVSGTISHIASSTYELAEKVSRGDLSASIDTKKFSGSWAKLAEKLNELVVVVNTPVSKIKENIDIMAEGNFSLLDANYPGIFGELLDSCNKSNRIAQEYVDELSQVLTKMADGNLNIDLRLEYVGSYAPIGEAIRKILDNLNQIMKDIGEAAEQVSIGSSQIAEGSALLADGVVKQNDAIESLKKSVEYINEKAVEASSSAVKASGSVHNTKEIVYIGGENVKNMAYTMNKIKESSENIGKINKAITDIAFQTNLLALNASVEAARAGEHGRGFSVVADEVRSLAGRSQKSAGETSEIVQEDLTQVAEGQKITKDVVKSFETIVGNVEEIATSLTGITELSNDQLESISEVNRNVDDITTIISDSSMAAQESASASEELSTLADVLKEKIGFFKVRGR